MVFSAMKFSMSPEEASPLGFAVTSFQVEVSNSVGRTVSFGPLVVMTADTVRVLWGDGFHTDYSPQNVDSQYRIGEAWHTYSADGVYVITVPDSVREIDLTPVTAGGASVWSGAFPRSHLITRLLSVGPHVEAVVDGGFQDLARMSFADRVLYCGTGVALGDYAMSGCSAVRSLAPLSGIVSSTGRYCFAKCRSLENLSGISGFLPVAEGSFRECASLVSLAGLDGATAFGDRMFEKCTALATLSGLPADLADLGEYTFSGCTALASVSPVERRPVVEIPAGCFSGCTGLTDIDSLAGRIESYGPDSFRGSGLTRLYSRYDLATRRAVVSIGDRSFMDTPLASINLLGTSDQPLSTLGREVFRGCNRLTTVSSFGWNISAVGDGVFRDCYVEELDGGLVVSERGLQDIRFVGAWHAYDAIPPYAFYGDARISSLDGLAASPGVVAKSRYGDYCFAGCSGLASLSGFPAASVSTGAVSSGDDLPAWPLSPLGRGVFKDLYKPPFQRKADAIDQASGRRPYHYRGLVDASVLASAVAVHFLPPQFMEGCALLEDLPEQPPACRYWGDRCFARCCNMLTLDALARMGVDDSDVEFADAYVVPKVPRFGAECFKDCSWTACGDARVPGEDDVFDPAPSAPPGLHSGLSRIGGLRVWVDRLELAAFAKVCDASMYLKTRWSWQVSGMLASLVQRGLGDASGPDYDKYRSVSSVLTQRLSDESDVTPFDGMELTMQGGRPHIVSFSVGNSGSGCMLVFVSLYYGEDGVPAGVRVAVVGFWADVGGVAGNGFSCRLDGEYAFSVPVDVWSGVLSNGSSTLYFRGGMEDGGHRYMGRTTSGGVDVGIGVQVVLDASGDVVFDGMIDDQLVPGQFEALSAGEKYRSMVRGYLLAAVAAYSASVTGRSAIGDWGSVDGLLSAVSAASSARVADEFRRALASVAMPGHDAVLGEGCFDGCRSLTVSDSSSVSGNELDGFPLFVDCLPARCFRNTSVVPTAAFRNIVDLGDYVFAGTPTVNLSGYPPSLQYIPAGGFSGCSSLSAFGELRNGIRIFCHGCFDGCGSLSDLRSRGMSTDDLDSSSGQDVASVQYSEFVDKYGYSSLATKLGAYAFRGTSVAGLVCDWRTVDVDVDDAEDRQTFVSDVFSSLLAVEVVPVGQLDDGASEKEFRLRLRTGSDWTSPEMVFSGYADVSDVDSSGFGMDGAPVARGCVRGLRFVGRISAGDSWRLPYTASGASSVRYTHAPFDVERSDYMDFRGVKVRVSCPRSWYYASREDNTPIAPCEDDVIRIVVGPYRVDVQICLSAAVTKNAGGSIVGLDFALNGVKSVRVVPLSGASDLSVPLFPLVESLGIGCFEDCVSLRSLDGFPPRVNSLPARCFAGCPFTDAGVSIPSHVTSVGADCFSFEGYDDGRPVLRSVTFVGKDAAAVRNMSNFPFGVPPGCSIYADSGLVYTEPSAG